MSWCSLDLACEKETSESLIQERERERDRRPFSNVKRHSPVILSKCRKPIQTYYDFNDVVDFF